MGSALNPNTDDLEHCGHCGMRGQCSFTPGNGGGCPSDEELKGFVPSAVIVFLLPLAAGIAGAYLTGRFGAAETAGSLGRWQSLGLLGGLMVGVILAKLLLFLRRPARKCAGGGDE